MVLAPVFLTAAPGLLARDGDRYDGDRRFNSRYASRSYGTRANPVRVALTDLQAIGSRARVDNHEAKHFRRAIEELAQFDERARRGRFDRGSLNDAIGNMEHLAQADQLHPRDRARLRQDLYALRGLRAQGSWR
ncbi:MAG: hypothetical protein R2762_26160 [Bryobacteraceae bacterium]